jgi:hypothetical protein
MFKHPYCGRQHETVAQARHCEAANTPEVAAGAQAIREAQEKEETWPWAQPTAKAERPAPKRFEDRPRTKGDLNKTNGVTPLGYAYAKALKAGNAPAPEPEFLAPSLGRSYTVSETPSCSGRNSEAPVRKYGDATDNMVRFARILLEERDWEHAITPQSQNGETIALLAEGEYPSFASARLLIETLKSLPKVQDVSAPTPAGQKEQPWKILSKDVPAGNYCVTDSEGKRHFYRVSISDRGFYKVQERASEELHFISLNRYASILKSILEEGVEKARLAYSTHMKRCWKCGLKLTDNTGNPYYSQGLGPDCGAQ